MEKISAEMSQEKPIGIGPMEKRPFFSIIIPVYNVAPYLRECLDSVLAQTFKDWEAICIDDGSTDGSGEILDEYGARDKRFRVLHQGNAGVSAARNRGLEEAKGEWVSFIDSDDFVECTYLETFVNYPSKSDINFFPHNRILPNGATYSNRVLQRQHIVGRDEIARMIFYLIYNETGENLFGYTWNKFIRASIIRENNLRFIEGFSEAEDELFAFEVCLHIDSLSVMSAPVYQYRSREGGLSKPRRREYERRAAFLADVGQRATNKILKAAIYGQGSLALYKFLLANPLCGKAVKVAICFHKYRPFIVDVKAIPCFVKVIAGLHPLLGWFLIVCTSNLHAIRKLARVAIKACVVRGFKLAFDV